MAWLAGITNVAVPKSVTFPWKSERSVMSSQFLFNSYIANKIWSNRTCLSLGLEVRPNSTANFQQAVSEEGGGEGDGGEVEEEVEEEDVAIQVLTAIRSNYNDIVIVDTPRSRMLLLDSTRNVHSIFHKEKNWTGSYWDEFASLPAIVPKGPIAIFGLGGGTTARLMLASWPSLQLEGWEIDEILIDKARDYLGLCELEKHTQAGGILNVHIGDVLDPSVRLPGGYAGIIVDLFSDGKVLPQLQEVATWLDLKDRLMPDGRLMVNCGGNEEASTAKDSCIYPKISVDDDTWVENSTIKALSKAFPGQLSWKRMPKRKGENYLSLTGSFPDLTSWSTSVPHPLRATVKQWIPYELRP